MSPADPENEAAEKLLRDNQKRYGFMNDRSASPEDEIEDSDEDEPTELVEGTKRQSPTLKPSENLKVN